MESRFSVLTTTTATTRATALSLFTASKPLYLHFSRTKSPSLLTRSSLPSLLVNRRVRCIYTSCLSRPSCSLYPSASYSSAKGLYAVESALRCRLQCVSSSAASFGTSAGGGGGGFGGESLGGGGGGGDGSDGEDTMSKLGAGAGEEVSGLSRDVIILDVGGMTCGGCAASVKRILESQPQVSSASVNLTTETAIVWPKSEAKVVPNWQEQLGEALAKHLTSCGFKSNLRGQGAIEEDISP